MSIIQANKAIIIGITQRLNTNDNVYSQFRATQSNAELTNFVLYTLTWMGIT